MDALEKSVRPSINALTTFFVKAMFKLQCRFILFRYQRMNTKDLQTCHTATSTLMCILNDHIHERLNSYSRNSACHSCHACCTTASAIEAIVQLPLPCQATGGTFLAELCACYKYGWLYLALLSMLWPYLSMMLLALS